MKTKIQISRTLSVLAGLALTAGVAHANIIVNGDFETGNLTSWTALGTNATVSATAPLAGTYSAVQTVAGGNAIYQTFTPITGPVTSSLIFTATNPGTTGLRSMNVYWRENSPTNQVNLRLVNLNGATAFGDIQVFSGVAGSGGTWQTVLTDAVAFGAPTILTLTFNTFGPDANYDLTVGEKKATGLSWFQDGPPANLGQMWFVNPSATGSQFKFDNVTVEEAVGPFNLTITPNGAAYDFSWDTKPGKVYDLLTSTDLATPITDWATYHDGVTLYENLPAAGTTTTLTAVPSADPRRFFSMLEKDAPPLFFADFEDNDGDFTTSKTAGTDWQWGAPTSTGLGGSVTMGAGDPPSAKCWGTNIGNPGFYADPTTESRLISPNIDLTDVAGAELSFSHAIDIPEGDTAELRIINATTAAVIQSIPFTDSDNQTANWKSSGPITLPVGAPIRLEWQLSGTGGEFNDYMGWYIDDVSVVEVAP